MDLHAGIIRHILGPAWARWERSPYLRHYRQLRRAQYDSPGAIRAGQWRALQAILAHAYETVPYYRDGWKEAGVKPAHIQSFDDFQQIPILTKSDIRAHGSDLLSYSFNSSELIRKKTSGSTGVSLEIFLDEDSRQWKRACVLRCDEWTGWRFGEPVAKVWGNPEYRSRGLRGWLRNTLLDREFYLDTLHMDEAALDRFVKLLLKKRPTLIFGHAHSVYLLAQYLKSKSEVRNPERITKTRKNESPKAKFRLFSLSAFRDSLASGDLDFGLRYRPKGIITTAMVLHSWQRRTIEQVFDCPVTNRYGCEEVSLIACECEQHQGLHVNTDSVFAEILCPDDTGGLTRPACPGESGSIVVTDLTNRAMPIIRYQVGDMAVASDRICPCGRGSPLLERIEGREADYVLTTEGELISGISLTENFALQVPGVVQFQIIQETLDRFRFRIVRGREFGPGSLERLDALVTRHFGSEVEYRCEYLDHIPPEASGKFRFCISRVPNPFTHRQEVVAA
ncbi:MAG TPA: phenylacetate--CoA ligase family protein [Gemmataceae bacterium]|nr:phenylacetate--CoA ligase family protein [Gemmataceae bacterium]